MKHAELFAGYGGLSLAVEATFGADLAWYAEFDPAPSRIMARHWPDAPNHHDVTQIDWSQVEPVDIISGGSPCQDVSAAGRRAGMNEGTRSNLWVAMREAIAQIKPTYVIWENVRGAHSASAYSAVESEPGLLGSPGSPYLRATGRVAGDLAALGYDSQWRTVSASSVGAPHRRERVFLLAWRPGATTENSHDRRAGRRTAVPRQSRRGRQDSAPRLPGGSPGGTGAAGAVGLLPKPAAIGKLLPTVEARSFKGRNSGPGKGFSADINHVVEGMAPAPRASHEDEGGPNQRDSAGHYDLPAIGNLLPTPKAGDADFGLPRTSGRPPERSTHLATRLHYTDFSDYTPAIRRWEKVLGRPAPPPTELSPRGRHRLSAHFTEFMMGLPAGWICDTPGISRRDAIKAAGNGVVPQQATTALADMLQHLSDTKEAA